MEDEKVLEEQVSNTSELKKNNNSMLIGFLLGVGCTLVIAVVVVAVALFVYLPKGSKLINYNVSSKVKIIQGFIDKYYLNRDQVTDEMMEEGIYAGIMGSLGDTYAEYYPKEEYSELLESDNGIFYGVGLYLQQNRDSKEITVTRPIRHSPAEAAGILTGDILIMVDGENITEQDLDVVVAKVKGPKGTRVKLTMKRGDKNLDFEVERDEIQVESVASNVLDDDIGYIIIDTFNKNTDEQFVELLDELKEQGIKGLIIDLRYNGGGMMDSATNIADALMPEGLIVSTENRNGKGKEIYSDEEHKLDLPIAVLVNEYSASSSEILTGALKDSGKAVVVGNTTFGKGITQYVLPLGDGSGIKLTVEDYYTPSGNNIHGKGIDPDYMVDLDMDEYVDKGIDTQLEKAKEVLFLK